MSARRRRAFTLIELLVVMAIVGLLIALLLGAVQAVRLRAAAADCQNRMRQIALALQNYHDTHGAFPPGGRGPETPQPFMSWMTHILPQLEQGELWHQALQAFAAAKFFEDPPHHAILGRPMPLFLCPLENRILVESKQFNVGHTSYLGVSGRSVSVFDGVLFLDSAIRFADITDGTSTTLIVGERPPSRDGRFGWWYAGWGSPAKSGSADLFLGVRERASEYPHCATLPNHFEPGTDSDCDTFHFWSRHAGGAHFVFCDGSVRFLSYSADAVMPALSTRAGGEAVQTPN